MKNNLKRPKVEKDTKPSPLEMEYKRLFLSSEGKNVLEDLKRILRHGQTIYQTGKSDRDNAFEQGRQSVINDILFIINK